MGSNARNDPVAGKADAAAHILRLIAILAGPFGGRRVGLGQRSLLAPLRAEPPATAAFAAVLRNAAGKPVENAVHWQVLRTMAKACYNARPLAGRPWTR